MLIGLWRELKQSWESNKEPHYNKSMKEQLNWIVTEIEHVSKMANHIDEDQRTEFLQDALKAIKTRLEKVNEAYKS